MTRISEGEPPRYADFSEMPEDQDCLREVAKLQREFAASDHEIELYRQSFENFGPMCEKAKKGFEAFLSRNNLAQLQTADDYSMLRLMASVGGDSQRIIRLTITPATDENGFFVSTTVDVMVEAGAHDGEKFMPSKPTPKFQLDKSSLGNVNRKIVPRLRRALRIARSITEVDLTESRPRLPNQ